jgi:hypothetical protein
VSCESNAAAASLPGERGAVLRQLVTADMPDSWTDVRHMKANASRFGSARQRRYVATLDVVQPTDQYSSAECLFMIVMQGGLADCLACSALDLTPKGDKDGDGAPEFLDAWGEPIHYVLWPGGFESPLGTKYFSTSSPFDGGTVASAPGGTMRPLIFSAGADKMGSTQINAASYLAMAAKCGDPQAAPISTLGGADSATDYREDNLTNFGAEVKK